MYTVRKKNRLFHKSTHLTSSRPAVQKRVSPVKQRVFTIHISVMGVVPTQLVATAQVILRNRALISFEIRYDTLVY